MEFEQTVREAVIAAFKAGLAGYPIDSPTAQYDIGLSVASILDANDTALEQAEQAARVAELKGCLEACQTRHPMESIDYLEARLAQLTSKSSHAD